MSIMTVSSFSPSADDVGKSNSYSETMLGFFWSLRQIFWIRGQPPIIG
jgi:hypothetical protein